MVSIHEGDLLSTMKDHEEMRRGGERSRHEKEEELEEMGVVQGGAGKTPTGTLTMNLTFTFPGRQVRLNERVTGRRTKMQNYSTRSVMKGREGGIYLAGPMEDIGEGVHL